MSETSRKPPRYNAYGELIGVEEKRKSPIDIAKTYVEMLVRAIKDRILYKVLRLETPADKIRRELRKTK